MIKKFYLGLLTLAVASGALAITINVDGDGSDWTDPYSWLGQDPNEQDIPDDYDIADVFTTDDFHDVFFRCDVWGTPDLSNFGSYYDVLMDIDQDNTTGYINYGIGAEYILRLEYDPILDQYVSTLYDSTFTPVPGADTDGAQDSTTETSVSLADLGIGPGHTLDLVFFINNGVAAPDDVTVVYTTQIPEPGTLMMVGAGLLAVAGLVRRR